MIKLDEFTTEEIEELKQLVDDKIESLYRLKERLHTQRLLDKKDDDILKYGLLKVKLGLLVGDYKHGE